MLMSTKCQKNVKKITMSYNMMIGYDIYDIYAFSIASKMTLMTKIYCSRLYIKINKKKDIRGIYEKQSLRSRAA
jgi:hypothetical protein